MPQPAMLRYRRKTYLRHARIQTYYRRLWNSRLALWRERSLPYAVWAKGGMLRHASSVARYCPLDLRGHHQGCALSSVRFSRPRSARGARRSVIYHHLMADAGAGCTRVSWSAVLGGLAGERIGAPCCRRGRGRPWMLPGLLAPVFPALPGCAASSGPASRALAALARAARDLFPVAGQLACRLRRLLRRPGRRNPLAALARGKHLDPPGAARLDLPLPPCRGHLTAGKGTTVPGRHQGRPALPVTSIRRHIP